MKRIVYACHKCRNTGCFEQYSEEANEFCHKHFRHGVTGFNPDSKEGCRHALWAGLSQAIVGYYKELKHG